MLQLTAWCGSKSRRWRAAGAPRGAAATPSPHGTASKSTLPETSAGQADVRPPACSEQHDPGAQRGAARTRARALAPSLSRFQATESAVTHLLSTSFPRVCSSGVTGLPLGEPPMRVYPPPRVRIVGVGAAGPRAAERTENGSPATPPPMSLGAAHSSHRRSPGRVFAQDSTAPILPGQSRATGPRRCSGAFCQSLQLMGIDWTLLNCFTPANL